MSFDFISIVVELEVDAIIYQGLIIKIFFIVGNIKIFNQ